MNTLLQHAAEAADHKSASGGAVFEHLFAHVVPHPLKPTGWLANAPDFMRLKTGDQEVLGIRIGGVPIALHDFQLFQLLAVVLILVLFRYGLSGLRSGRPNRMQRVLVGFVQWIRDEMVVPVMGKHHGEQFLPYFLSVFFFIAVANLLGLFPLGSTATSSIFVTAGMASTTFLMMLVVGMIVQGPIRFWLNLVPPGVPAFVWPVMFVVELMGLVVKPVALTIRLFANMTGGHLVVLSFMGLIFYFAPVLGSLAYGIALPAVAMAVFIMIIEAFVALLQAYIFTLLSISFVQASLHAEH